MTFYSPSEDTIAAIATAVSPGQGSIAVVRVSGPLAVDVSKKIIRIPGDQKWATHKVLYGHVLEKNNEKYIDEVLVIIMKAPRSFTGEDIVEIHCHGGIITVQRILERILEHKPVRRAEPEIGKRRVGKR